LTRWCWAARRGRGLASGNAAQQVRRDHVRAARLVRLLRGAAEVVVRAGVAGAAER
jgi:hypothetical protein